MESKNHIHSFENVVIPATCKENGYTLHKCDCGYQHKDEFTPMGNHTYELMEESAPTCTASGNKKFVCSVCGETKIEASKPLGHDFSEWTVQEFATCTEDGKRIRVCNRCNQTEQQIINATGHKLTNPRKSETKKGHRDCFCENCGQTITVSTIALKSSLIKKVLLLCAIVVGVCLLSVFYIIPYLHHLHDYSHAIRLIEEGKYSEAREVLKLCGDFKDSQDKLNDFKVVYEKSVKTYQRGTRYEYEYDNSGNITREIFYSDLDSNEISYEISYEYSDSGRSRTSIFYDDDVITTCVTKYNQFDDIVSSATTYDKGQYKKYNEYKYEFEYDKNDRPIVERVYYNNELAKTIKREYDENGNLAVERDGTDVVKYTWQFDDNGFPRYVLKERNGVAEDHSEFVENKYGDNTGTYAYNTDGTLDVAHIYRYDDYFNLIAEEVYRGNDKPITITKKIVYEYDANGYISKATKYKGDLKEYEITYINPTVIYCPNDN